MPRLSVLMPARNSTRTVGAALRSTLRAMPRDAELVVLDDGSDDSTAAAVEHERDPRIVLIRNAVPGGVTAALNRMLEATDSEFVGRMDADDVTLPWRFTRQLEALDSATDIVFSTVVEWFGGLRVSPGRPERISPEAFPLRLLITNPVAHPTMLARRSALDAAGGYRNVPAEDYDLWLRVAVRGGRIRRLATPALVYRIHEAQVSGSAAWRRSSWDDALVAEAYERLSLARLGDSFRRLPTLATSGLRADEFESELRRFSAALRAASRELGGAEQRSLSDALTRRTAAMRALHAMEADHALR